MTEKLAYNMAEAAQALGIGKSTLYNRVAAGEVMARKLFGRTIIFREELERVLAATPPLQPGSEPDRLARSRPERSSKRSKRSNPA
jgi:excisionase family DNA binding protein